jgi:SAM-dependent methyltransferase
MLEIGSGPGRFTEIALSCGAKVFSLESSDAVFVNAQNNAQDNLCLIKASLYDPPFSRESFDYLFCFGVLQHTPDVHRAFHALFAPLKTGGKFCLDLYAAPYALLHPRQMIRPFTRKMDSEKLYRRVSALVPRLLPLSDALLKIPWAGEALARLVPVANWKGHLRFRDREQSLEWSILDTFDWYSPVYEKPQFLFTLKKWCREAKFQNFSIQRLRGVYVIRGTK